MAGMTTISDPYGGDPLIYDIGDGADLNVQGGQPRMSSGLENYAYLCLFVDANWWGNDIDPANPGATGSKHFLPLLDGLKLTPSALDDLEAAAALDLSPMTEESVVKSVDVSASITGIGSVGLELTFTELDGTVTVVRWKLNWARIAEDAS